MTSATPPEPGELIKVGHRLFLVTSVKGNVPAEDTMPQGPDGPSHVVRLLSLEEDAFGDVEEIIWENEPDIRTLEKPRLPDLSSMDDPNGCSAVLNSVRWSVVDFIRRELGEAEPVVEEQIENAMRDGRLDLDAYWVEQELGSIARTLIERGTIKGNLDSDGYWGKKDGGQGGPLLKSERGSRDHLRRLKERLKVARADISATHERLELVVEKALDLVGQPPLEPATLDGEPVDPDVWSEDLVFLMPRLHGDWAKCAEGLEHPQTGKPRPITFDYETAAGRDDIVLCHLNHPLVQMAQKVLRSEIWASGGERKLSRFQIRGVDENLFDNMVTVHALLLVTGRSGHLIHQELINCAVEDRGSEGPREVVDWKRIEDQMAAWGAREEDMPDVRSWFAERWAGSNGFEAAVTSALEAQVEKRMKSIETSLIKRRKEEIKDQISPLREMALAIRQETKAMIADHASSNLEDDEQWDNSLAIMRARLELVEPEAEQGAREIKGRYSEPRTWVFPVTVALMYPREVKYM